MHTAKFSEIGLASSKGLLFETPPPPKKNSPPADPGFRVRMKLIELMEIHRGAKHRNCSLEFFECWISWYFFTLIHADFRQILIISQKRDGQASNVTKKGVVP